VYIELSRFQTSFKDVDPIHAVIGCVNCHGGQEPADYSTAHDPEQGFMRNPSEMPEASCNPCHSDIVARNEHSMHSNLWGEQFRVAERTGYASLDVCPESVQSGWESGCFKCHATCGECHISKPNSKGGGLAEQGTRRNHAFAVNQLENCIACHETRMGLDLTGGITGIEDVHYQSGIKCWDCHTEDMHGDGTEETNPPQSRYHINDLPTCDGCHLESATSNSFHSMHWPNGGDMGELACYICHSQPYKNCSSCHVGGTGALGSVAIKFGRNYDTDLHKGEYIAVRHIPVDDSTFVDWGEIINMNDESQRPNWEYTSPHNIRKYTTQTRFNEGESCGINCHLSTNVPDSIRAVNTSRFLFRSDLLESETGANDKVTVDDDLPSSWIPIFQEP